MGKRALVILGAGAAHNLIPLIHRPADDGSFTVEALGSVAEQSDFLEPPLTKDVFRAGRVTKELLDTYKRARDLSGPIRIALLKDDQQLEPLLKGYYESDDDLIAKQYPEIPLYLRDLFVRVSRYTNQPVNYQELAHRLSSAEADFEQIAYLTLNYDTLLDEVLFPDYLGGALEEGGMKAYIGDKCMLVKLHGSVNWVKECEIDWPGQVKAFYLPGYLDTVASFGSRGLQERFQPEISIREATKDLWEMVEQGSPFWRYKIYYPALSVPLGDYDMNDNCPRDHIEALREFLGGCRNVLAIGVSGRDGDLLKLLKEHLPEDIHSFWLVDKGADNAQLAYGNFLNGCPQLIGKRPHSGYRPPGEGFTDFILDSERGLAEFIRGSA